MNSNCSTLFVSWVCRQMSPPSPKLSTKLKLGMLMMMIEERQSQRSKRGAANDDDWQCQTTINRNATNDVSLFSSAQPSQTLAQHLCSTSHQPARVAHDHCATTTSKTGQQCKATTATVYKRSTNGSKDDQTKDTLSLLLLLNLPVKNSFFFIHKFFDFLTSISTIFLRRSSLSSRNMTFCCASVSAIASSSSAALPVYWHLLLASSVAQKITISLFNLPLFNLFSISRKCAQ